MDPVDLVSESLRRIEEHNPELNAVVAVRAEEALAEAEAHDRRGPLAGLPLLVKDMARCRGMRTTFGSPIFADAEPDEIDDVSVARLRAAGAIVVGRTNSPEFGHAPFTDNPLFGPTRNPWNTTRSPGGSSGGSSAALAAGLVPIATTSDGGGSVRIPASMSGLVGYKPTMGAIGRNVLPRWIEYSTQGVTAATVADVVTLAEVMFGPADGDWLSLPAGTIELTPRAPGRVLACRTFRAAVDPVIDAVYERTLDVLAAGGFTVQRVDAPSDPEAVVDWFKVSCTELAQSLLPLIEQWDLFSDDLRGKVDFGLSVGTDVYLDAQRSRHELGARLDALLEPGDVLVTTVQNVQSWGPGGPPATDLGDVVGDPTLAVNTPELNATGHPAVSVPIGHDDAGVPFGLQVIARRHDDAAALGLAAALEQLQPWALNAPGYPSFAP